MGETSGRKVKSKEMQRLALEYRKAGATFNQIADKVGYHSPQAAYKAIKTALRTMLQEPAEAVRKLELARLDRLMLGIWEKAVGNPSSDPNINKEPEGWAIDRVMNIMERRARLVGIDAPIKVAPTDPTGTKEYESLSDEERIARIAAILQKAQERLVNNNTTASLPVNKEVGENA